MATEPASAAGTEFDPIVRFYDLFYGERVDDLPMYRDFALAAGGPLLELGCGTGRLLVPLAAGGQRITGLDVSAAMLAATQAKVDAAGLRERVSLVQADMRNFSLPTHFAMAYIPINTFMHCYDGGEQLTCLRSIRRALQPGGRLVVDVFHPDLQALLESDGRLSSEGTVPDPASGHTIYRFYTRRLDLASQTQHVTYIMDEVDAAGVVHRTQFSYRLRFVYRYEMEYLLRLAGFSLETVYGSYDLEPFESGSEKMIFVARID